MMGFDSALRGPELSQTGACSFLPSVKAQGHVGESLHPSVRMNALKHEPQGCKETRAEEKYGSNL